MRLKDTELDSVLEALTSANPTSAGLRAWLNTFASVATVAEAGNLRADARVLVNYLDGAAPNALLQVLDDIGVNDADVKAVAERYRGIVSALSAPGVKQPWSDRLLYERTPFLDRKPFREYLAEFVAQGRAMCVVVRGPTRSGKTWTAELVRHVAEQRGDKFALVASALAAGVSQAVSRILEQLGAREYAVEPNVSPDSHWYNQQCTRILAAAETAGAERCWIVIDRIGPEGSATVDLCDYLLETIATSMTKIRLVLLGYPCDHSPDTVPEVAVEWEWLEYGQVAESDVKGFVEWLYREIVKQPLTPGALAMEIRAILGGRLPTHPDFLALAGKEMLSRTRAALLRRGTL